MPIYLVRWPDLSASFVQAEGEAHLLDILDQVGNPDDCEWSIYEGPLFIDFRLPVEWSVQGDRHRTPIAPEQVVLGDVGRLVSGSVVEAIELSLADADDGYQTGSEVLRLAFPKLHALIDKCSETGGELDGEVALPEADLREALHIELERFLRGSWRRAKLEKKTDAISRLAREMDLSIELARTYEQIARKQQSGGRDAERPPQEKPSTNPPLFRISNHHTQDCGQPPAIDGDTAGKYVGYFANQYGEQAVFVYDYQTREASVWMGETGWGKAYRVVDGRTEGITLTESEATWIRACWLAAAGEHSDRGS